MSVDKDLMVVGSYTVLFCLFCLLLPPAVEEWIRAEWWWKNCFCFSARWCVLFMVPTAATTLRCNLHHTRRLLPWQVQMIGWRRVYILSQDLSVCIRGGEGRKTMGSDFHLNNIYTTSSLGQWYLSFLLRLYSETMFIVIFLLLSN